MELKPGAKAGIRSLQRAEGLEMRAALRMHFKTCLGLGAKPARS